MVASCVSPTGDLACNQGMCRDWELNQQPFGSQLVLNPLSYTSQGKKKKKKEKKKNLSLILASCPDYHCVDCPSHSGTFHFSSLPLISSTPQKMAPEISQPTIPSPLKRNRVGADCQICCSIFHPYYSYKL